MSEPMVRPNGKPYRPRKSPAAMYLSNDDDTGGVMVIRTHEEAAHREWAARVWAEATGDVGMLMAGRAMWTRLVPWDDSGWGDQSWILCDGNDPRACPAVWYEPAVPR